MFVDWTERIRDKFTQMIHGYETYNGVFDFDFARKLNSFETKAYQLHLADAYTRTHARRKRSSSSNKEE